MKITNIIPTWNSDAHSPAWLSSLARQTFKNFEVVIIDNGSIGFTEGKISSKWPAFNLREIPLEKHGFFRCIQSFTIGIN
jgi:GT2 family glycosyltransferase